MKRKLWIFLMTLTFVLGIALSSYAAQGLSSMELLGRKIYNDRHLSLNQNQPCKDCHNPGAGFADPLSTANPTQFPVSRGSDGVSFGGRNAPTAAYCGYSPLLYYDPALKTFIGGMFWDGRASGLLTSGTATMGAGPTLDPLADQAKGPIQNPVEMALTSDDQAVGIAMNSNYSRLFERVFGAGAFMNVPLAYNQMATAMAAFERSPRMNRFNSRYDRFVQEQGPAFDPSTFGYTLGPNGFRVYDPMAAASIRSKVLSSAERDGLALFNSDSQNIGASGNVGGMCYKCHPTAPVPAAGGNALFTDFTYDNLGIPVNPQIASLKGGPQPVDYGLGDKTRVLELQTVNPGLNIDNAGYAMDEIGKFRVPTLRNVGVTAPYGHNGYFATLPEIVNFYNIAGAVVPQNPAPEVPSTVNRKELGNLGLSAAQEANLVKFMLTLTDR